MVQGAVDGYSRLIVYLRCSNNNKGSTVFQAFQIALQDPLNVYHPFTGVTNNQSESFNSTLKRLQRCREVPVDSIVLTLYHLQAYYHNEIQRICRC